MGTELSRRVRPVRVLLLGVTEFRRGLTTHFEWPEIELYDTGRELAHRLTFRYWDNGQ